MSYDYQTQRANVFSEDGQKLFLAIRDQARALLAQSGAVTSGKLMAHSGDTWDMLACMDRLIELGELIEIPNPVSRAGQHRIFIAPYV
jgi:hypothetical protein